jgi:membrane protease YdiL (CAAX protease family)
MFGPAIPAGRSIVGALLISLTIGWLDTAIRRWLGLESLVVAGWISLLLAGSTIAFLLGLSRYVREACMLAVETRPSKTALAWSGFFVVSNVVVCVLVWAFHVARPADVAWTHYFSLPPDSRPSFLLHYLLVSSFVSCVVGPVAEEFLHTGVVIGSLRAAKVARPWIHAVNALLFVLLHQAYSGTWMGWEAAGGVVVGRLLLDSLYYKTGTIAGPIVCHMIHNICALVLRILPI